MRPKSLVFTFFLGLLFFVAAPSQAQKTIIHGTITDSISGDPLPYVNVSFIGLAKGTTTNEEGEYRVSTHQTTDSLKVSFLGYKPRFFEIEKGKEQRLDVALRPSEFELEGIEIRPKDNENPAHPILRNVIANKKKNNSDFIPQYEYKIYNKVGIGMKVRDKVINSWILKPFRFVFENIDSSKAEPYLPIFISESFSKIYYRKNPRAKTEYVKATHVSGMENPSINKYMGNMYQELDIYDDNIVIFDKSFKSPIGNSGFAFYNYYLMDSISIDDKFCYKIKFIPRRKGELTFKGNLFVHDKSFAVKRIEADMSEGANINYIRKFDFIQDYERFKEKYWVLKDNDVNVEAAVLIPHNMKFQEFYAHKSASYQNFVFDKKRADSIYNSTDDIAIKDTGNEKSLEYWGHKRPVPLTENEKAIYEITDSIKKMPHYKVLRSLARGYAEIGPIEIGPYFGLYSFNEIEGNRFKLKARTKAPFNEKLVLDGYGAYGTADEQFKYGGSARFFFNRVPTWDFLGISYKKDLEQLGKSQTLFTSDNILTSTFRRNPANKLNGIEEYRIFLNKEWPLGFTTIFQAQKRKLSPRGALEYKRYDQEGDLMDVNSITTSEVSLATHFGYKERFYNTDYRRLSVGSNYPIIDLDFTYGFDDFLGSDYGYQKLVGSIYHNVRVGYLGKLTYRVEGGKYWGALPYPLLELHDGNETFFLNEMAFNTMNYYEFISDEYASLSLTHHFEGLFFNQIPFLRKLKFREVVSGKAVIGNLSDANKEMMLLPANTYELDKPFVEASVGIENIFSFIRIDGVWRLTYLDHPDISKFGIRATVQFGF